MGGGHNIALPLLAIMLLLPGCYEEVIVNETQHSEAALNVVGFNGVFAFVDNTTHFMLYTIGEDSIQAFSPVVKFGDYQNILLEGTALVNGQENNLGLILANHPYRLVAQNTGESDTFNLVFTTLPILRVSTQESIPDEPKILSWFELQYSKDETSDPSPLLFESYAGIEIRGKSATRFDKKAYGIELWDNTYQVDRSAPLLGMRYCEDWILDAMYIDDLRMRNKISFELWERMASTPSEDQMDDVYPGIHFEYVEIFVNNRYEGLYCLGEKMDEKLIRFSKNQSESGGVLYKAIYWSDGSTKFESYDSEPGKTMVWDGWEQIYPGLFSFWNPLVELRKTVVFDDDETFEKRIGSMIDLDNAADYFLFINLILGYDNVGKNIFYARYTEDSRLFILPWDIEATWGRMWDRQDSNTFGILGNNLYKRLIELDVDGFNQMLNVKWDNYRKTIFRRDSLMHSIEQYHTLLKNSGAIYREKARWHEIPIDYEEELNYISSWLDGRLEYLDRQFD